LIGDLVRNRGSPTEAAWCDDFEGRRDVHEDCLRALFLGELEPELDGLLRRGRTIGGNEDRFHGVLLLVPVVDGVRETGPLGRERAPSRAKTVCRVSPARPGSNGGPAASSSRALSSDPGGSWTVFAIRFMQPASTQPGATPSVRAPIRRAANY
jgi:hypothetical protein